LSDGFIVDVNVKFTLLSEYLREDLLGSSIREIKFWENKNEQMFFLNDLISFGQSENTEFVFRRKGGSQFFGVISSNIILIQTIPHVVSVIHDITERKEAEQHIQDLLKQLEIEKNTAQVNAITDSLTGLGNRRYFDVALEREFYRLKRSGATLSLIIIDVDHFKKFNDKYGHLAGDDCLIQIGNILKAIAGRAPDIVTRYGGEEFVVILPETESDGAKVLAERIRKDVEELGVPHATSETAEVVTVSLGVVSVKTNNLFSQNQVLALADEALYVAKEKGRNRIIIANGKNTFESKEQIDLFTLSD
jgi:diguanylate cyclase (GGDEF)-like protein/PAS domain S-box-containing protein